MSKKDEVKWMPYDEYVVNQYFVGKATEKDYELVLQYRKDKKHNIIDKDLTFGDWLKKKENP
jgi:hypothetical protein